MFAFFSLATHTLPKCKSPFPSKMKEKSQKNEMFLFFDCSKYTVVIPFSTTLHAKLHAVLCLAHLQMLEIIKINETISSQKKPVILLSLLKKRASWNIHS